MQPNALWLSCFARQAKSVLEGRSLTRIFSTSAKELYLEFETCAWKTEWHKGIAYLFAVNASTLPKKNRLPQFRFLEGRKIKELRTFQGERALEICFGEQSLIFRLFGNKGDVLAYDENGQGHSYRHRYSEVYSAPGKYEGFAIAKHTRLFFEEWRVQEKGVAYVPEILLPNSVAEKKTSQEWLEILLNSMCGKKWFLCIDGKGKPWLQLEECKEQSLAHGAWMEVSGKYHRAWFRALIQAEEKRQAESRIRTNLKRIARQQSKLEGQLHQLEKQDYRKWADNLMAAMHRLSKGLESIELEDVYGNGMIRIPLKKELSAQQNAERFYRKARNQHIEKEKLQLQLDHLEKQKSLFKKQAEFLETKGEIEQDFQQRMKEQAKQSHKKFREFVSESFKISVGKSAENNDELLRVAHKNDFWLHARKLKGAHVIIHCANAWKEVSPRTKAYAASLAAWFSEGKGSSLVPVIITQRKYVRKKKGLHKGQVIVEREEVILAEPLKPGNQ